MVWLLQQVESLSAARKSSMGGSEPSDAIRVVNALLTQIDKLSRFPNVLVLTTSNITGASPRAPNVRLCGCAAWGWRCRMVAVGAAHAS